MQECIIRVRCVVFRFVLYCTVLFSVLFSVLFCSLYCSVLCTILCTVLFSVLYYSLYCTILCTVLFSVLYCSLYCSVLCTVLFSVLFCPVRQSALLQFLSLKRASIRHVSPVRSAHWQRHLRLHHSVYIARAVITAQEVRGNSGDIWCVENIILTWEWCNLIL
jgi:hypothetical protein